MKNKKPENKREKKQKKKQFQMKKIVENIKNYFQDKKPEQSNNLFS